MLAICFATVFSPSQAADSITDTRNSPFARIHEIGLGEVQWTDGFWADRFRTCRQQTVPSMGTLMQGVQYKPFLENFRIAAGMAEGDHHGASFNDGDFYKWIEAACAVLAVTRDADLEKQIEQSIAIITRAQRADGYIHTPVLIRQRNGDATARPFQDRHNFEMYNMGHLMTAACLHHRVTGRSSLLDVAKKTADFLIEVYRNPTPDLARNSVCPSHYMGIIELYRVTGEPRYLELATRLVQMRDLVRDGGDDNQDRLPFVEQTEAAGHAVRANYLYAGIADLYAETGDERLLKTLETIWQNVVTHKMYITGGCGALYDGASPDGAHDQSQITRVHQSYGRNYQLPNLTAYNETCANIGNVLWNWRMFLLTGEARYIDVLELTLYNSVLSAVSLDGTHYFYVNPLRHLEPLPTELRWSRRRVPFISSFCCPPNVARTIAEVNGYAYSKTADSLWVNLYGSNTLQTQLGKDQQLELKQQTNYPWNGQVQLQIVNCGKRPFAIKLRIPGWTPAATLFINGQQTAATATPGTYADLRRHWQRGDVIQLDMSMPHQLIESHPLVEETLNQVAIKRGPLIYCLESIDIPEETNLRHVLIPADIQLTAQHNPDLLQGITTLKGQAFARQVPAWSQDLYRPLTRSSAKPAPITLIPYYTWANRKKSEMSVWLPVVHRQTAPHADLRPKDSAHGERRALAR